MATGKILIGEDGKFKYQKDTIEAFKKIIDINKGAECYLTLTLCRDVDYKKDLIKYYSDIIVPEIFEALKSKGVKTIRQTHEFLKYKFSSPIEIEYKGLNIIPLPIEDMDNQQRVKFVTQVGVWATQEFGIHFKSVTEIS